MAVATAYLGGMSYYRALMHDLTVEQMESFEKQTFRNRCTIRGVTGYGLQVTGTNSEYIRLTVPVKKVEHKQLTRDIEISYQTRWQHQHWIAIESAYRNTPYFDYYADYLRPYYEKQYRWLLDLNCEQAETILRLMENNPIPANGTTRLKRTEDWSGETWTDQHPWQTELSIIDTLFEKGPQTILCL